MVYDIKNKKKYIFVHFWYTTVSREIKIYNVRDTGAQKGVYEEGFTSRFLPFGVSITK